MRSIFLACSANKEARGRVRSERALVAKFATSGKGRRHLNPSLLPSFLPSPHHNCTQTKTVSVFPLFLFQAAILHNSGRRQPSSRAATSRTSRELLLPLLRNMPGDPTSKKNLMLARRIHKELSILSLATSSAASCSHRNCTLRTILWTLNSPTTPVAGAAFHHVRRFPTRPIRWLFEESDIVSYFMFHPISTPFLPSKFQHSIGSSSPRLPDGKI